MLICRLRLSVSQSRNKCWGECARLGSERRLGPRIRLALPGCIAGRSERGPKATTEHTLRLPSGQASVHKGKHKGASNLRLYGPQQIAQPVKIAYGRVSNHEIQ